jgi:hypothetical protein
VETGIGIQIAAAGPSMRVLVGQRTLTNGVRNLRKKVGTSLSAAGLTRMAETNGKANTESDALELLAGRLERGAGISHAEVRELIRLIGTDWNSPPREAHFLKDRL